MRIFEGDFISRREYCTDMKIGILIFL